MSNINNRLSDEMSGEYQFKKREDITYHTYSGLTVRDIIFKLNQLGISHQGNSEVYNKVCSEIAHQYCSTDNSPATASQLIVDEYYTLEELPSS